MKRLLARARTLFPSEKRPVATFAIVLSLSMLCLWLRHEIVQSRYQPPRVHVRWNASVVPSARTALEARHQLTDPQLDSGRTWSYLLTDTSAAAIRRLVSDSAVEDTQNIDRPRFRLIDADPPGTLDGPLWLLWAAALGIAMGVLAAFVGADRWRRVGFRVWRAGTWVARPVAAIYQLVVPWLTRGIPELRAEVLGFFRFFYAAFLFLALAKGQLELEPGRIPDDGRLDWEWLGWLSSRADLMVSLEYALLALIVLFAIGLWTRLAYVLIAAGMTVWALVWIESQHSDAHPWLVLILMIVCLVPVPWDVAPSVDGAIRRRRRGTPAPALQGKLYGYAVWVPGLILGTIWASAAFAKMDISGPMWVLGGAVKYHWVVDGRQAPVDWGLWVASHHWAAVVMSGVGIALEAMFIVSVFLKPGRWRYLFVSTGLALLAGFYLFQGLLWLGWWLVFLSFAIPWAPIFDTVSSHLVGRHRGTVSAGVPMTRLSHDLGPIHVILIVLVCLHAMLRLPAGFGRFESYSGTYGSTAEFDKVNPIDPDDRLWLGYGSPNAIEVDTNDAVVIVRLASLRALDQLAPLTGNSPRQLMLTRQRVTFDWVNGRFHRPDPPVVMGTLDLESMTLVGDLGGVSIPVRAR